MKNQLLSLREITTRLRSQSLLHVQGDAGHPVNRVENPKRIIEKMEGRGGGEAQGVTDQKSPGGVV
jgi:hypothetical protein